jgi:hypothetical protein
VRRAAPAPYQHARAVRRTPFAADTDIDQSTIAVRRTAEPSSASYSSTRTSGETHAFCPRCWY